ncbi:MAG: SpoIIE family protein phosphatase [Acidobacteria bacterium]|nr:SpoIIE family protein phosphatase [Acidobacteriota bacterium]
MLPRRVLASKYRWVWLIFLFLSPLAYAAGMWLIERYDPISRVGLEYDREGAVELAQIYALDRGFEVRGWETFLSASVNNSLSIYYRIKSGAGIDRMKEVAPPIVIRVLFVSPDNRGNLQVFLTPQGRPTGYRRLSPGTDARPDAGADAAREMANATLGNWFTPEEIARFDAPDVKEESAAGAIIRTYRWKPPLAPGQEAELGYTAVVRGDRIVREEVTAQISKGYQRDVIFGGTTLTVTSSEVTIPGLINLGVYYLLIAVLFIIGFYRFIQRARQRELSYQRMGILTVLIAALFLAIILLTDVATYEPFASTNIPSVWFIYIFGGIGYLLMGLLVAIAYGGGEGDLREQFHGKLTSLDALLKGKLFSRNVARAVVLGCAFGGWGVLAYNVVPFLWINDPTAGKQIQMLDFLVGRLPWISPLVMWPFDIVFTAVFGLLLPLPFLQRRIRRPGVVIGILTILAWIAGTGAASAAFTPWLGAALIGAAKAALLLIPFFLLDLLTALVALAGPTFVAAAIHLTAQPAPALQRAGYISFAIAGAVLLVEVYFVYRGRTYREEEVRPLYARLIAERLSMQAEVSAAREAQVRLMPDSLPRHPRLSIAAECRPAHEVGGDFFEVFELDSNRVGIFMAEGGGKGLASALSIAYAKGFLLPKIGGDSSIDDSPTEVVRSLQSQLRKTMIGDGDVGLAFLVLDTSDRRVRYARTGVYPRVFVGQPAQGSPLTTPDEQEIVFGLRAQGNEGDSFAIVSGEAEVEPCEQILLLTDGVASAMAAGKGSTAEELGRELAQIDVQKPEDLDAALKRLLDAAGKNAQSLGITDDLTALILRINAVEADTEER